MSPIHPPHENEREPLLSSSSSPTSPSSTSASSSPPESEYGTCSYEVGDKLFNKKPRIAAELMVLLSSSLPLVFAYLLQYSLTLISLIGVGRLGSEQLAAGSLAIMTSNLTGIGIYDALATSLDTLCAQAYGSGRHEFVGIHVQRMIHLMTLCTIPMAAMWLSSPYWLGYVVAEQAVAYHTGLFLQIVLIGNPGYIIFEAGRRFAQAQGLFNASMYILLVTTPIHALLTWLFVVRCEMGLNGAALALGISRALLGIFLIVYITVFKRSSLRCWSGFQKLSFQGWGRMIKLAVPGVGMIEAELIIVEFLNIAPSYLSVPELAAQAALVTIVAIIIHIPFAISVAASTRVGHLVGAGIVANAKMSIMLCVLISVVTGLFDGVLLFVTRHPALGTLVTDPQVIEAALVMLPAIAVYMVVQSTSCVTNGILRGLGAQKLGAATSLLSYIVIAIPFGSWLCFGSPHMRMFGLWTGATVAGAVITVIEGIYCLRYNWEKAIDKVRSRDSR